MDFYFFLTRSTWLFSFLFFKLILLLLFLNIKLVGGDGGFGESQKTSFPDYAACPSPPLYLCNQPKEFGGISMFMLEAQFKLDRIAFLK
jgi:hypothetical protein